MAQFSFHSLYTSMNELSNHDHSRFLTRTNQTVGRLHTKGSKAASEKIDKNVMAIAVLFQMTWPGSPTIYYGDEIGMTGWSDPDNRRAFCWDNQDKDMLELHRTLIRIHKENIELSNGSLEYLYLDFGIISFGRWFGSHKTIVILNNNDSNRVVKVPVWKANVYNNEILFVRISVGAKHSHLFDDASQTSYIVKNGYINIDVACKTGVMLSTVTHLN
jgi:alpha-glucosidase